MTGIVVYGDIVGFSSWEHRVGNQQYTRFLIRREEIYRSHFDVPGYFYKSLGDGFMAVKEVTTRDSAVIADVIERCLKVTGAMEAAIAGVRYPRPEGFRIRVAMGTFRRIYNGRTLDYSGYPLDLAHKLLSVRKRSVPIMAVGRFAERISLALQEKVNVHMDKLPKPDSIPDGVYEADMNVLYKLEVA